MAYELRPLKVDRYVACRFTLTISRSLSKVKDMDQSLRQVSGHRFFGVGRLMGGGESEVMGKPCSHGMYTVAEMQARIGNC